MELKFIYPRWGSAHIAWNVFLTKVKTAGYAGVEIDLPTNTNKKKEIVSRVADHGLQIVAQHWETKEADFNAHKESYEKYLYSLAEANPLLINSHTGMDFFSFEQNTKLIKVAQEIEVQTGIPITHETHRSRFSFAAHICHKYLQHFPDLKLTSDFSHWCCVAESLLENQQEALNSAITNTYHIHARVGSSQTPQVMDPREERFKPELDKFTQWWHAMIKNAVKQDRQYITITPEYGPYPYANYAPYTENLLGDQWEINQFIKDKIDF